MKKIFVLLIIVSSSLSGCFYQQYLILEQPESYKLPTVNIDTNSKVTIPNSKWEVVSDRIGNKSHEEVNSADMKEDVFFLENFFVIKRTDNWLHIIKYKENKLLKNLKLYDVNAFKKFRMITHDYGWVPMNNVLLWTHCLVDSATRFNLLGVIINDARPTAPKQTITNDTAVQVYLDPDLRKKINIYVNYYDVYFVYKIAEKSILIGKEFYVNAENIKTEIVGWIPKEKCLILNKRIFLEPNWDADAAKERADLQFPARAYFTKTAADKTIASPVKSTKRTKNNSTVADLEQPQCIWNNDPLENRMNGSKLRFYQVDDDTVVTKIGTFGAIPTPDVAEMSLSDKSAFVHYTSNMVDLLENKKLVFVSKIPSKHISFYTENYTPYRINILKNPLYKKVILLSKLELDNLVTFYADLVSKSNSFGGRVDFITMWTDKYREVKGIKGLAELKDKKLHDIKEIVFGFSDKENQFDHRLAKYEDKSVISDDDFASFLQLIDDKVKKLKEITSAQDYQYAYKLGDKVFYWVPLEIIP